MELLGIRPPSLPPKNVERLFLQEHFLSVPTLFEEEGGGGGHISGNSIYFWPGL